MAKYDPAMKAKALAEYIARPKGVTSDDVGKKYGLPGHTLENWKCQADKGKSQDERKKGTHAQRFTEEFKQKAIAKYKASLPGGTFRSVSEEIGMNLSTLAVWVKDADNAAARAATPARESMQVALFDTPQLLQQLDPAGHAATTERQSHALAKLREENARLMEENVLLRGMTTLAIKRGFLDLFGLNQSTRGKG